SKDSPSRVYTLKEDLGGASYRIPSHSNSPSNLVLRESGSKPVQQHIARMRFLCQFNIEGRVKQVNAQLIGEIVYCEEMVFSYSTQAPNFTAAFAVIWDVNKTIDNPENIHVLIFRCSGMGQSCGVCLELPEKYKCGWCQDTDNSCQVYEHCNRLPTLWLDRRQTCPNPQILSFTPKSGPWEGGTNITIRGINLGRVFQDIANNIRVIHEGRKVIAECVPHEELYVKTTQIVCHVEKPPNLTTGLISGPMMGYIEVKVLHDYIATSREQYSFVVITLFDVSRFLKHRSRLRVDTKTAPMFVYVYNPRITSIKPSKGPKSGGTALAIWGLHMDAGSRAEAYVGGLSCNVTSRDASKAVCVTSASRECALQTVRIKFDNGLRVFEDYKFLYVEDPFITYVESGSPGRRGVPKGIPSGGIAVSVKGTSLNAAQYPYMYIIVEGEEFNGSCIVESQTEMKCKSPRVPAEKLNFSGDAVPIALEYGFKMDNVAQVQNLSSNPRYSKFMMYPDPIYHPFSEKNGIKYFSNDYLTIDVAVGDHLSFTISKLCYELPSSQDATLTKPVIIGVISGLCILVGIVILLLIAYHRKSTESRRILKNMQEPSKVEGGHRKSRRYSQNHRPGMTQDFNAKGGFRWNSTRQHDMTDYGN
ncbi:Plexin-A4, partial [Araneus ventricosus]